MNCRFVLLLLCLCIVSHQGSSLTDPNDANALTALKQSWNSASLVGWDGDPCDTHWVGVKCDNITNTQVISLDLSGMQLTGNLPEDVGIMGHLTTLDLSLNSLTGPIPIQIGKLRSLTKLSLHSCNLTGQIPPELGNLSNLTYLDLYGNLLTGNIPPNLGLLSKLYWFDLAFNQLSGSLPVSNDGNHLAVGLDNLTSAYHFHLNNNLLSGKLPKEILNSKMSLIHLLLDSNQLIGTIPDEIVLLKNITVMNLSKNKLSGTIPFNISQLVTLSELYLDNNVFTGALPNLSPLSKLEVLRLGNNCFDSSPVPLWLIEQESLRSIDIENGNLSGEIPSEIFDLSQIQEIKLDNNKISGSVSFSTVSSQLQLVSLTKNKISSVYRGPYKRTLLLQGNPVCHSSNMCASSAAPPSWIPSESTCSTTCQTGLVSIPILCSCADPLKGIFLFTLPISQVFNSTVKQELVQSLASLLYMSSSQIWITNASFQLDGTIIVYISFFPENEEHWSQSEIQRISSKLSDSLTLSIVLASSPLGLARCVALDPYDLPGTNARASGLSTGAKIGISTGVAALVMIMVAVCVYVGLQKWRSVKASEKSKPFASWGSSKSESIHAPKLKGARWFSYAELKKATDNFSENNEIGSGGYGKVYKGILLSGEELAIKRAADNSMQGAAECKNEIELLSRVHHKNIVGLVGFCFEQGEQMLVYEYMANGSLKENLSGLNKVKLDWQRRLMIALDSARGIAYLHELANPPIIHRDIKSSNILLDERCVAKVGDFGLSKIGPGDQLAGKGYVSTQVKGTLGYMDPEYYMTQQLTEKSDVYSFGVVLLELVTARQPIERGTYVVREVKEALDKGGMSSLTALLDPNLKEYPLAELQKLVNIALHCVEEAGMNRPTMSEVVKELEVVVGQDLQGSGSVGRDLEHPYYYGEWMQGRRQEDVSFEYSGGYEMPHTVEPK